MKKFFLLAVVVLFSFNVYAAVVADTASAPVNVYVIDNAHSQIGFSVKHMMISMTKGFFGDYAGTLSYDPKDSASFKAEVTIQTKSINTNNEKRDEHLRSPDFFDAAQFPTITFTNTALTGKDGKYTLRGKLAMHGVTQDVSFPVEIAGPINSPMGGTAIGLTGQLTINRQDFGIKYNKTLDNGGLAISDDVVINVDLEAHKK